MMTRKHITKNVVLFKTYLRENNLEQAGFALDELYLSIDALKRELDERYEAKEAAKTISKVEN